MKSYSAIKLTKNGGGVNNKNGLFKIYDSEEDIEYQETVVLHPGLKDVEEIKTQ